MAKRMWLVGLLAVVAMSSGTPAAVVSLWNFDNLSLGNLGTGDVNIGVPDTYGMNPGIVRNRAEGYAQGVVDASGSGVALRIATGVKTAFTTNTTNGCLASQGIFTWDFRSNGITPAAGDFMLNTPFYRSDSTDPYYRLRLTYFPDGGTQKLKLYLGGPTDLGEASGDLSATLFDGNWHTVKLIYKDGEAVRVQVDGVQILASSLSYVAADYLTAHAANCIVLGNMSSGAVLGMEGDYDNFSYDDRTTTIQGTVALQGFMGTLEDVLVTVTLVRSGTVVRTEYIPLDVAGQFTLTGVGPDLYNLTVKTASYLRQTVAVDTRAGSVVLDPITLVNGDLNGNNHVDFEDFSILQNGYGQSGTAGPGPAPAAVSASGLPGMQSDDFNDGILGAQWVTLAWGNGTVSEADGVVHTSTGGTTSGSSGGAGYQDSPAFELPAGNFDIRIDIVPTSVSGSVTPGGYFQVVIDGNNDMDLFHSWTGSAWQDTGKIRIGTGGELSITGVQNEQLRAVRVGTDVSWYSRPLEGGDWTLIHSRSGFSTAAGEVYFYAYASNGASFSADWDNFTFQEVIIPVTIQGTVTLQGYQGDLRGVLVTIVLTKDGSVPRTERIALDSLGQFSVSDVLPGEYNMTVEAASCLRQTIAVDARSSVTLDPITLVNGDLNSDNQVSFEDFSILQNGYGQSGSAASPLSVAAATSGCGTLGIMLLSLLALACRCAGGRE